MRSIAAVALVLFTLLSAGRALGEPPEDCKSPRAAVNSVFGWQEPEHFNPAKAMHCLDRAGRSASELRQSAQRIKAVYEARALKLDESRFSTESGWVNPETGKRAFAVHRSIPGVQIERQADGEWRWSRASLDRVDELFEDSLGERSGWIIEKLPGWAHLRAFGVELWQAVALLLILLVAWVVRGVIRALVKVRLSKFAERRGAHLTAQIAQVFATPGASLLLALMLRLVYPSLGLPLAAALLVSAAVSALVVFALVVAIYRLVDVFATHLGERAALTESKLDDQFVPLFRKATKVLIVIAGVLVMLQNLNVNVMSLVAGLGIGGLAVALAAKDSIANLFGSIMIFTDRPFTIGDWVKVEEVEGKIEAVGFRSTRIRTLADTIVTMPNARFMEAKIENFSEREARRVTTVLGLTYDTPRDRLQAFVEGIRAIIRANPLTRKDKYEVHFSGFGASALEIYVHFYVRVPTWSEELRERHNVFSEVLRLAQALGVSFAFPTQTLHVESLAAPGASPPERSAKAHSDLAEVVRSFGPDGSVARPEAELITEGFPPTQEPLA